MNSNSSETASIHLGKEVVRGRPVFHDRRDAGKALARFVAPDPDPDAVVLGLPRGGVPVGVELAGALQCPLDVVVVRKLPIPSSPEMGFGAMTLGGEVRINTQAVRRFGITEAEIEEVREEVHREIRRRARAYRGDDTPPDVEGRDVYLVDDGLATGFTALAAADALKASQPKRVRLCAPVSPLDTIHRLAESLEEIHVLLAQTAPSFAVASFYEMFPDLTDGEVQHLLSSTRPAK